MHCDSRSFSAQIKPFSAIIVFEADAGSNHGTSAPNVNNVVPRNNGCEQWTFRLHINFHCDAELCGCEKIAAYMHLCLLYAGGKVRAAGKKNSEKSKLRGKSDKIRN